MVEFNQVQGSRLFESGSSAAGAGWWGVQIGKQATPPKQPIPLGSALSDAALDATFVYAATAPKFNGGPGDFIKQIDDILSNILGTRALILLPSGVPDVQSAIVVPLTQSGGNVQTAIGIQVTLTGVDGIDANLTSGATLTVDDAQENVVFAGNSIPAVRLIGSAVPKINQLQNNAILSFVGESQGTFRFPLSMERQSLKGSANWGFQVLLPNGNRGNPAAVDPIDYLSAWLPLASGSSPSPTDFLGFIAQINLVNPNNLVAASQTAFFFTGQNDPGSSGPKTTLDSCYRTSFGKNVTLLPVVNDGSGVEPAALVINPGYLKTPLQNGFHFAPAGDFALSVENATVGTSAKLLCGISGNESIDFLPAVSGQYDGFRLRFTMNRPAFIPQFPIPQASPVGPPIDPKALPLTELYQTSWATVIAPPADTAAAHYTAAPKGSNLFGLPDIPANDAVKDLLLPKDPGVPLPQASVDLNFPLLPFSGFQSGLGDQDITGTQMDAIERQILSVLRRLEITNAGSAPSPSARHSLKLVAAGDSAPFNSTTPSGFITRVDAGKWTALLLGQIGPNAEVINQQMGFTQLEPELQAAFQSDNLFLVVANGKYLGTPASGVFMPPDGNVTVNSNQFFNTITIADWAFAANTGTNNKYSDYRNVILVKGVKGKLTDLILSPDKWTMKDRFAAPTVTIDGKLSDPDIAQLIPLSSWLKAYFDDAIAKNDNPYFSNFANIAVDDNWTGVLILRADIAAIPKDLAGITAGISDDSAFYAHHVGIEISQIEGKSVTQKGPSSLFGLIYYVDPLYDDTAPAHAIAPTDLSTSFDFRLLTLKALFKNSVIQKFESLAQVVLNQIFGSSVDHMGEGGNVYNAILLQGAVQKNGSATVYSLSSATTNTFYLQNNVLTLIEIDTAQMSTRDDGSTSGTIVSWIAMSGYLNFAVLVDASNKLPPFDLFSFGSDTLRQGLNFINLGLLMKFTPSKNNSNPRLQSSSRSQLSMDESEISFNIGASVARPQSLFLNFQLELLGIMSGDDKSAPEAQGFITVGTPYGLAGVSGHWHGLRFKLNLGTPGALASKINLSSSLLLAWADSSSGSAAYSALVGLQLPGAGSGGDLFSLQTVIRLSVGALQLFYTAPASADASGNSGFLLVLNEIALKIFGLLKIPPNGSTQFFLFGNSQAADSTGAGWLAIYNQDQKK